MIDFPEEWAISTLEQLGRWGSGGTPSRSIPSYYENGTIPWLVIGDLNDGLVIDAAQKITEEAVASSSAKIVPLNSVLIAMYGSIGKIGITGIQCATNQAIAYCVPDEQLTSTRYLFYSLMNQKAPLIAQGKGGAQQNISQTVLKAQNVPLAPLAEQKVIADKLDALLAQVDTLKARLEAIPAILKRFRQSVLSAAVTGKLTEEWRIETSAQAWSDEALGDAVEDVVDCPHSTPAWSDSGFICVRTTGFTPFHLDLSNQGFVTPEVFEERIKRIKPQAGDILYSREGTVGIACQIPEGTELCLGQRMVLIRSGPNLSGRFLTIVLNSEFILSKVRSLIMGSTAPRINVKDIKAYRVPLPSALEQTEIVHRVESLFAFADQIEARAQEATARVKHLTQSILAKAFRGELTEEWRKAHPELVSGENSAEALLDRIRAARGGAPQTTGKRGRKPAGQNSALPTAAEAPEPRRRGRPRKT